MKIEIEFDSSTDAVVTIDGRKMKYGYREGFWRYFEGLGPPEQDRTVGGIVALRLMSPMIDILQGWIPNQPTPNGDAWETWQLLPKDVAEQVEESIT